MIETDSIIINGLDVLELNYDYDLVNQEKLLNKYLNKNIFIYDKNQNKREEYRLLSTGGMVLEKVDTKEIVINPSGEIILPKLPDELIVKPALVWKIKPCSSNEIKVSYITKGLNWTAEYVINTKKDFLDLSGWVNINNTSGTTFENTKLKLIAGIVNRASDTTNNNYDDIELEMEPINGTSFEERSFNDYHLYTMSRQTTLKDNQSKEINFLNIEGISYKKYYEYYQYSNCQNPNIVLEFENKQENGLGIPLPQGKAKIYSQNEDDSNMELIGESTLNHTPKDEIIKLSLGKAFDIICKEGTVKDDSDELGEYGNSFVTYHYNIVNHKDEDVIIKLFYGISHNHWKIEDTSDPIVYVDSSIISFCINLEANEKREVKFLYSFNDDIKVRVDKDNYRRKNNA